MSKENVKQFLKLIQEDAELKTQVEQAMRKLGKKNIEKVFDEEVLPIAKGKGLEFTFEELQNPFDGKLSDDELDKAVGGMTDENGYWLTTVGYSCGKWAEDRSNTWYGVQGTCGSCCYWHRPHAGFKGSTSIIVYFGATGSCMKNRN